MVEDEDLKAIMKTLQRALAAHVELVEACKRMDEQIKDLRARVEALERLRAPRAVPPSRNDW